MTAARSGTKRLRVLITGSREWLNPRPIKAALLQATEGYEPSMVTVVHGAARGADSLASWVATELGFNIESHPADWERYGKSAGPRRNEVMANLGADVCLAFPVGKSTGTRHMMRLCIYKGIPIRNVEEYTEWLT